MINQISFSICELIDQFESEWSPSGTSTISKKLEQFGLADDEVAITELVRIDIERRYCSGLSCRLNDYFSQFPTLLAHPDRAVEIAFEDYRVCTQLGHPIPPERYRGIPGIETQRWHQQFQQGFLQEEFELPQSFENGSLDDLVGSRQVDQPTRRLLSQIGFEPIQRLGSGAFSQVFLARQSDLASRYVVLKVVRQPRGEPQMMAMLQHTNIVPIYSFHFVDSHAIICMPYAGGVTLNDYILNHTHVDSLDGKSLIQTICDHRDETIAASDKLSSPGPVTANEPQRPQLSSNVASPLQRLRSLNNEQLAIWMFERLAGALSHSHARGVLHGDIKPANVLIRNDGEPALMDFNLSRSLQRSSGATVGGTLAYMAPENLRRMLQGTEPDDERSDIYSLGMMLFELLTENLPYPRPLSQADTDLETAIRIRQQPLSWPTGNRVSHSLRRIVNKCLEYDPSRRYESAEQLQEDLQHESQNQPLRYAEESPAQKLMKWVKRHPRLTSAASVAALSLMCVIPLIWAAVSWRSASIQAESTVEFNAFSEESNEALLTMMANPQRFEASEVRALLLPLEESHLLDQQTISRLITPEYLDPAAIEHRRGVLLRHTVSAGLAACEHLRQNSEAKQSHDMIANLVASAKYLVGQDSSRALAYLEARFAELTGEPELSKSLLERAEDLPIQSDSEYYLEAMRLMADRKWGAARDILGGLADRNVIPTTLRWTSLGRTQLQLGQYEDAKLSFTQSLERAPKASRLWLLRASCWGKLGDLIHAESDIKQAMTLEPSLGVANYQLAMVYLQTDRVQEAIDVLTNGLQRNPDQFPLLTLRSRAYRRLDKPSDANRDRTRAMALTDLPVNALTLRAQVKLNDVPPDLEGALADLKLADKLAPLTPSVMQKLAYAHVRLGDTDAAIKVLENVRDREPDNEKAIVYLAVLLARQGRHAQAVERLTQALVEPNRASVLYQAACVHALLPGEQSHIQALRYLSSSVQRGYGSGVIADDQDLDSLRSMPGFQAILRTTRLGKPPLNDDESSLDPIEEFSTLEL